MSVFPYTHILTTLVKNLGLDHSTSITQWNLSYSTSSKLTSKSNTLCRNWLKAYRQPPKSCCNKELSPGHFLPDPCQEAICLLTKLGPSDVVEVFLYRWDTGRAGQMKNGLNA